MSALTIYQDTNPNQSLLHTQDGATIARELNQAGVQFERWATLDNIDNKTQEAVLDYYQEPVAALKKKGGYQTADIISLSSNHPDKVALRQKFLSEHRHNEDEVRFFVEGKGLFTLHIEDKVYSILCERGDLIKVPANTRHWFDMGSMPEFTCIRLFTNPEGWIAQYTGDDIAQRFPGLA